MVWAACKAPALARHPFVQALLYPCFVDYDILAFASIIMPRQLFENIDFPQVRETLKNLKRGHEAAGAIFVAAAMDDILGTVIKEYMPALSNRLEEKLFKGYGPLGSFSAKIDISYALGIIPSWIRQNLHIFREIRNELAHSPMTPSFENDAIILLLKKFRKYDKTADPHSFFLSKARETLTWFAESESDANTAKEKSS